MTSLLCLLCALTATTCVVAHHPTTTPIKERGPGLAEVIISGNDQVDNAIDTYELDTDCPIGTKYNNSDCTCQDILPEALKCDAQSLQLSVTDCHCVTFDNLSEDTVEGKCFANCYSDYYITELYQPIPQNGSKLNYFMCEKWWYRTGRLCGECLPGHSPLAYSYHMQCVECPEGNRNIWKYILAAFGPLTVFYFLVLFLKVNVTSSHLHGYLIFAQLFASPAFTRTLAISIHKRYSTGDTDITLPILTTAYGIWNLDFFRWFYSDICLDVSKLTVLALDYAVAIYPLLLTVVSYVLIELYARNVRIVVVLWKPFQWFLIRIRRNWECRRTVIDAFATFFLLSSVKMAWTSFELFIPVKATSLTENEIEWVYYLNATVVFFGRDHLPYAILAIVFCFLFSIIPILLLLFYQAQCSQRILNYLRIHHQIIKSVMDSFQGRYKNGTETKTKDCRWFSAIPLLGQFILSVLHSVTLDITFTLPCTILAVYFMLLTMIAQPYKSEFSHYTKIDAIFWATIAICGPISQATLYTTQSTALITRNLLVIWYFFPLFYMICASCYCIISTPKVKKCFLQIRCWRRTEGDNVLPDRVINPQNYQETILEDFAARDDTLLTQELDTY